MPKKYLCGITFTWELGETDDISVYDSLEELKNDHKCWQECGIVELETKDVAENHTSHKWLVEMNLKFNPAKDTLDKAKDGEE